MACRCEQPVRRHKKKNEAIDVVDLRFFFFFRLIFTILSSRFRRFCLQKKFMLRTKGFLLSSPTRCLSDRTLSISMVTFCTRCSPRPSINHRDIVFPRQRHRARVRDTFAVWQNARGARRRANSGNVRRPYLTFSERAHLISSNIYSPKHAYRISPRSMGRARYAI